MTGGGSGGHITPILAVAHELKELVPEAQVLYIGQKGDSFASIVAEHSVIDDVYSVQAGKFRRYHGEGLKQLLDFRTLGLNLRDGLRVVAGFWQSFWLLGRIKPDAVFCKGGFIGVPVGLAAALRRIPFVTHDSDAIPGLANRIIGRWAACHAVALPVEGYPYPKAKTVNVGVPVSGNHEPVTPALQARYKQQLGLDRFEQILLVTGGGLGAVRLNDAMVANAAALLEVFPKLCIVHTAGKNHEKTVSEAYSRELLAADRPRVIVRDYVNDLYKYSGAADVVVARGGATNFAEFAQQGRACVIVPNPLLTGGHQTKNAEAYARSKAIVLVTEDQLRVDVGLLGRLTKHLLERPEQRTKLEMNIRKFARPDAAHDLAELIITIQKGGKHVAAPK